jgi:hypothetical protein
VRTINIYVRRVLISSSVRIFLGFFLVGMDRRSDASWCRDLGSVGGGLGTLLTGYFTMLSVQFSCTLQCLCVAMGRSRIVVNTVPVLGQVSMDKRGVKANTQ